MHLEEEDKALILLSTLPKSFENFKDTLLFGSRDTITLEEVQISLKCKDLQKSSGNGSSHVNGEELHIKKGNSSRNENKKPPFKGNYKNDKKPSDAPRNPNLKCFHCHETGHFKKQCSKWQEMMARYAAEDANKAHKHQANQVSQ